MFNGTTVKSTNYILVAHIKTMLAHAGNKIRRYDPYQLYCIVKKWFVYMVWTYYLSI